MMKLDLENFLHFLGVLSLRHDPYENSHAANTATLVGVLATAVNYPMSKMDALRVAARVHDIGKLLIPETILNKRNKLTVEEMAMIHRHVQIGYTAIVELKDLDPLVATVVLQHHERMDGTGYPSGLRGDAICHEARMIGICDTFDALTSHRSYRQALDAEAAVEIMERDCDRFDPILLDIFIRGVLKK